MSTLVSEPITVGGTSSPSKYATRTRRIVAALTAATTSGGTHRQRINTSIASRADIFVARANPPGVGSKPAAINESFSRSSDDIPSDLTGVSNTVRTQRQESNLIYKFYSYRGRGVDYSTIPCQEIPDLTFLLEQPRSSPLGAVPSRQNTRRSFIRRHACS